MQRLFTVFPGGAPGTALLLLRLSVAGSLCLPLVETPATGLVVASTTAAATLLVLGLATPLASLATAAVQLLQVVDDIHFQVPVPVILAALIYAATALALALIGPGAFSLDARLFGRRVLASS